MNGAVPMLAIDGPSGAGKGTVAGLLAHEHKPGIRGALSPDGLRCRLAQGAAPTVLRGVLCSSKRVGHLHCYGHRGPVAR